jgi:hypothetical protein
MYKKYALILFSTAVTLGVSATAAAAGWKPYGNTNPITSSSSRWVCGKTIAVTTDEKVVSQVCTVRNPSGEYVQGAVIVRNNRTSLFSTTASMSVHYANDYTYGSWSCSSSGVAANSWSVCFGTTFPSSYYSYYTKGYANNVVLPRSPLN